MNFQQSKQKYSSRSSSQRPISNSQRFTSNFQRSASNSQQSTSNSQYLKMLSPEELRRKEILKGDAQSTLERLPGVLQRLRRTEDAKASKKYSTHDLHYLDPSQCPKYSRPAVIRVLNMDTINAAIKLADEAADETEDNEAAHDDPKTANMRPLIVNFAHPQKPGGGWLNGQIAQEEALCYRSSLALSLRRTLYPLRWNEIIYSPYALVIREDMAHDHRLYTGSPLHFPSVSCVTVAALRNPRLRTFIYQSGGQTQHKSVFHDDKDRSSTKVKMRQTLRAAAIHDHRLLVLGALGCGVHNNPIEDVAHCWLEVLRENEFEGNWWREVWFAVYDPQKDGTFAIFDRVLSGKKV